MHLIVICDGLKVEAVASPLFLQFTIAYKTYSSEFKTHRTETSVAMLRIKLQRQLETLRGEFVEDLSRDTVQELYDTFLNQYILHYATTTETLHS